MGILKNTISLTHEENNFIRLELNKIKYSPYSNYIEFEKEVLKIFWKIIPTSILNRLYKLKNKDFKQNFLLISNSPVDINLIPTPIENIKIDFNIKKTFLTEACSIGYAKVIGDVFGYKNEKEGFLIHNNFPTISGKKSISNESSERSLPYHNENIHLFPYHPDYILLSCLRNDLKKEAVTYLLDINDVFSDLSEKLITILKKNIFYTLPPQSFKNNPKCNEKLSSIIDIKNGKPIVKIEFTDTKSITFSGQKALDEFKQICNSSNKIRKIKLNKGDILIFDNHNYIHSRSSFFAKFDGFDRWIQRLSIKCPFPTPFFDNNLKINSQILNL